MSTPTTFDVPRPSDVAPSWTANTIGTNWQWHLDDRQIEELVRAGNGIDTTDREALVALALAPPALPSLAERIDQLRSNLLHGHGLELIRGLPVDDIGDAAATGAMLAFASHLGPLRPQNGAGDMVGNVRNTGAQSNDPTVRLYQTSERQTFHTDSADVVGLLALAVASEGGDSLVVNAQAVYHAVYNRRPDLVAHLFSPLATDRRGEVPADADPWFTIPVFTWFDGRLTVMYQRQYIDSAQRFAEAPALLADQIAALDVFDEVCNDPALQARMTLEVGDMQFVHNHSVLHDRTGFVDDPARPRHLIRTWTSVPEDRALHPVFEQRYGSVIPGERGGVNTTT